MKTIAWIVGGTSGIGLETASRLKDDVNEVVAIGRNRDHIASARDRLGRDRSGRACQIVTAGTQNTFWFRTSDIL